MWDGVVHHKRDNKNQISNWLLLRLSLKNSIKTINEDPEINNGLLKEIYTKAFEKVLEIMKQIENEKVSNELHIAASYSLDYHKWYKEIVKNKDIESYIGYTINYCSKSRIIYIDGERVYNGNYTEKYVLDSVDTLAKEFFENHVIDTGTVATYHPLRRESKWHLLIRMIFQ